MVTLEDEEEDDHDDRDANEHDPDDDDDDGWRWTLQWRNDNHDEDDNDHGDDYDYDDDDDDDDDNDQGVGLFNNLTPLCRSRVIYMANKQLHTISYKHIHYLYEHVHSSRRLEQDWTTNTKIKNETASNLVQGSTDDTSKHGFIYSAGSSRLCHLASGPVAVHITRLVVFGAVFGAGFWYTSLKHVMLMIQKSQTTTDWMVLKPCT